MGDDSQQHRRRGRPPHAPTVASRACVRDLVAADKSVADIAAALSLSEPTVRAHYAAELAAPRPQINFPFAESGAAPRRPRPSVRSGRPEHVPNAESHDRVSVLAAGGMAQWQIAAALDISVPTLVLHYAADLQFGRSRKRAQMLEALFAAGVTGGNVSAMKAFLILSFELQDAPTVQAAKFESLGKKEQAIVAAGTAAHGTDWANLLPN